MHKIKIYLDTSVVGYKNIDIYAPYILLKGGKEI